VDCLGDVAAIEAACFCQTREDCRNGNDATWTCTSDHRCLQTCVTSEDCTVSPAVICEDSFCRAPACGNDNECSADQQCMDGACTDALTPDSVVSCRVLPSAGVLNAGGSRQFRVISFDATGREIPYEDAVKFDLTGPPGLGQITSMANPTAVIVSGTASLETGTGTLTAAIGSTMCDPATVFTFAAPPPDTLRVTVADRFAGTPIADALVVDGKGNMLTSQGDGTYTEPASAAGTNTFTAFKSGHAFLTVADTAATDVFLPLKPEAPPGTFTGTLAAADFNGLSLPDGNLHVAFTGASIPGNAIDLPFAALGGSPVATNINLGGPTSPIVNLPPGTAVGLGPTMFKDSYAVDASPGVRALWTLGGNVPLASLLSVIAMEPTQSPDLAQLLIAMAPSLDGTESGVTGGVRVQPQETGAIVVGPLNNGTATTLTLAELLRLHLDVAVSDLPTWSRPGDVPGSPTGQLDGALVVGGVLAGAQGFVPLGFSAAANDVARHMPNVVAGVAGGADGVLPLRLSSRSGGLEGSPYLVVALALDTAGLDAFLNGQAPFFTLSGTVLLPGELSYDDDRVTNLNAPAFLALPEQPTFDSTTRTLSLPATDVPGVAFHRLLIGTAPDEWEVYFPPGETAVPIPFSPMEDPLQPVTGSPLLQLASVTLGLNGDGSGAVYTYDGVTGFQSSGPTLDDLTLQIDRFSIEAVAISSSH
jgi:hypothetical protein